MSIPGATRFLNTIWRFQPEGHCFLSNKDWTTGEWSEVPLFAEQATDLQGIPTLDDLYFAPCSFSEPRRLRKHALGGRWLFADLDEVDPRKLDPRPTVAWETSPGRFQAMWLLDRTVPPRRLERLNQRLTYFTGADKGGWSLTKVLRVPGSRSTKYDEPWTVRVVTTGSARSSHTVEDMTELLKDVEVTSGASAIHMPQGDLPDRDATWKRRRRRIPVRARQLINAQTVLPSDDRSARMWELENLLLDAGLKPEEVLVLVRATIWNKYRGQRRELVRIWTEIAKAHSNHTAKPKPKKRQPSSRAGLLPNTLSYDDFMNREWPKPSWLVEGWWTAGAYGILAGEYKAFKTMLLLNLALAVASGKPFLGRYPVASSGMVNYIHEEGRQWSIHDRMARIAHWMDLTDKYDATSDEIVFQGRSLPITITSLPKLNLLNEDDQAAVAKHVETTQPKLVILETFYLLAGGASESALEEVAPMLEFLAYLSHTYGCAVLLSHHFHKSSDDRRFLDRISGSNIFGRWYESLIAVERQGEETDNKIKLVASHRDGASTQTQLTLNWTNDDDGSTFDLRHVEDDDPNEEVVDLATSTRGFWVQDAAAKWDVTADVATRRLRGLGYTISSKSRGGTPRRWAARPR